MRLEGVFGLAKFGGGVLSRSFAKYSAGYAISSATGALISAHFHMPAMPHFPAPSGAAAQSFLSPNHTYTMLSPMYEIMRQQLEFQQQQLEFQQQQHLSHEGQSGLIKEMLVNFDNSFRSMMDVVKLLVTPPVSGIGQHHPYPDRHPEPVSFQTNYREDNVINLKSKG